MVVGRLSIAIRTDSEIDSRAFLSFKTISKRAYENKILMTVDIPRRNKKAALRYEI
jgi:hypothetical protein